MAEKVEKMGLITNNVPKYLPIVLCLLFMAATVGCRDSVSTKRLATSSPITEEFREIPEKARKVPSFAMDKPKEINLQVLHADFDAQPIEDRSLSFAEWDKLKSILNNGIEVENIALLALSAQVNFLNEKREIISFLSLYWTSDSGDVYFQNKQGWFKVSDRAGVRQVIRGKSKT